MRYDHREWIPLAEAARRIESSHTVIRRLIDRRELSVRRLPGTQPRVKASELARLASDHTSPPAAA